MKRARLSLGRRIAVVPAACVMGHSRELRAVRPSLDSPHPGRPERHNRDFPDDQSNGHIDELVRAAILSARAGSTVKE